MQQLFRPFITALLLTVAHGAGAENCASYPLNPEGYICDWMLCGPFPNEEGKGMDKDYLADAGGESAEAPDFTKTWEVSITQSPDADITAEWFPQVLSDGQRLFVYQVDLGNIVMDRLDLGSSDYLLLYGFVYLESSIEQEALIIISTDDEYKAWFNGEPIGESRGERDMVMDQEPIKVTLKKGRNRLLVKSGALISQVYALGESGYQFMVRVTDLKRQPLTESVSVSLPETDEE
ncbi:MAG: hypothetical protein Q7Q73_05695 [Verrucomicrobiota bacterium JB024]|nr:hypothetical protein [Verrucomicrobiota bacterium JB024]